MHCCVLKGGLTQPQCRGARPVLDALPLRLPHASSARDAAQRRAEAGLGAPTTLARQRARLAGAAGVLAFTRRPASDDAAKHERISRDLARAANEAILQKDRAVLRQPVAATKDGAYARAYAFGPSIAAPESLDLARRIAASHGEDASRRRVDGLVVADGTTGDEDAMDEETSRPGRPRGGAGAFPVPLPLLTSYSVCLRHARRAAARGLKTMICSASIRVRNPRR